MPKATSTVFNGRTQQRANRLFFVMRGRAANSTNSTYTRITRGRFFGWRAHRCEGVRLYCNGGSCSAAQLKIQDDRFSSVVPKGGEMKQGTVTSADSSV